MRGTTTGVVHNKQTRENKAQNKPKFTKSGDSDKQKKPIFVDCKFATPVD